MSVLDKGGLKNEKVLSSPLMFCDGDFFPSNKLLLPMNTQALNYGTGIFEGIRAHWNEADEQLFLFRPQDHFERMLKSAECLMFDDLPKVSELVNWTIETIKKNGFRQNVYVRPLLLKKHLLPGEGFGVKLKGISSTLSITALPMGSYVNDSEKFLCKFSKWQRLSTEALPIHAKMTGSYLNSALSFEDARSNGFDDAIMLTSDGTIAEATTSNVFWRKGNTIYTPSLSVGVLDGVTRRTVIDILRGLGFEVKEVFGAPEELMVADECCLTATGIGIRQISGVEHLSFPPIENSVFSKVKAEYSSIVLGKRDVPDEWCVPIY